MSTKQILNKHKHELRNLKNATASSSSGGATYPVGGTTGQVLSKIDATDSNVEWADATGATGPQGDPGADGSNGTNGTDGDDGAAGQGVPVGGTTGQVLEKIDGTDYNTQWATSGGGSSTWLALTDTPGSFTADVYAFEGTYVGNLGDPAAWGTPTNGTGTGAGIDAPSNVVLDILKIGTIVLLCKFIALLITSSVDLILIGTFLTPGDFKILLMELDVSFII